MTSLTRHHGGAVIALTFVVAMMLTIMPLPEALRVFRPDWTLLVLVYWALALPLRIGVGIGWLVGIFQDVLTGSLLGQHALSYSVVAYLTLKLHQRIRLYPLWQQALSVLVLLTLGQLLILWVNGMIGRPIRSWLYWSPSVFGAAVWPVVYAILRSLRRQFRVT
jgi:rod shape-determining protein MreD